MLKKGFLIILLLPFLVQAQMSDPVKWKTETKSLGNNEFEIITRAKIDKGWHLYSKDHFDGGVGIPASFDVIESDNVELIGELKELGELHEGYHEFFEQDEKYYEKDFAFCQKVKLKDPKNGSLKVEVGWQVCDDEKCLPPDFKEFNFSLEAEKETAKAKATTVKKEEPKEEKKPENTEPKNEEKAEIVELKPEKVNEDTVVVDNDEIDNIAASDNKATERAENVEKSEKEKSNPKEKKKKRSYLGIFIAGFLGGFAALLMPCLYPMIPLTVSIFTKQSESKGSGIGKAILYGLSIIGIYVGLGLLVTIIFGADALNVLSTNPWINIGFFVLFIIFALSFFGLFELTLPSKWINNADKKADKGGLIGIFFMAITLVLVSFSCTGPIIGTLLVEASKAGERIGPALGMFGFSLALAIPFTLFAIFPSWLNSLPKSGGWMNVLKVSFGFLELAFALKFLSNADLVWQAHWLERELFIAIWIAIFLALALYLFNIFKTSHDSDIKGVSTARILFGTLSLTVVFYLLPGMWGAPLKLLSGLTPPRTYAESPRGFNNNTVLNNSHQETLQPEHTEIGPNGIPVFLELDKAFDYAEKVGKPVMIDFTGDACANCRKMEETVWVDERVLKILKNDVVVASLFADRRVDLPKEQQIYSEEKGRKLRTIGDKWSAYQIKNFESNSQPLYVIVDRDLTRYNEPTGAIFNADEYLKWLEGGIKNFKNR